MFYHSLISDWNHGNAHFLRGIAAELLSRGHNVQVYEPADAWSVRNLLAEYGNSPIARFRAAYPGLSSIRYDLEALDLNRELNGADLVIVHEWNDHALVKDIGRHREIVGGYKLLFHDTHHRSVTDPGSIAAYDLSNYDGVLAYGDVIRDIYLSKGWAERAWTWHEAADIRIFQPVPGNECRGDIVWIGNWGDEERTGELKEFFIQPVKDLSLDATAYGVRYPDYAWRMLADSGIHYGGWLPNYEVPSVFAGFKVTVHIPRRPYVDALRGIPTIRPFEALACGIPLVCSPWRDAEGLFTPGKDFLLARDGKEMKHLLRDVIEDRDMAHELSEHGRCTILARHTCAHRVDELLLICRSMGLEIEPRSTTSMPAYAER